MSSKVKSITQADNTEIHDFVLPSGVKCGISPLMGLHFGWLYEAKQSKNDENAINRILADRVKYVGDVSGGVGIDFIKTLLSGDRDAIIWALRLISYPGLDFHFKQKWPSNNGNTIETKHHAVLSPSNFPTLVSRWVKEAMMPAYQEWCGENGVSESEDGFTEWSNLPEVDFPVVFSSYREMLQACREYTIELPSGKVALLIAPDGKTEDAIVKAAVKQSGPVAFINARTPRLVEGDRKRRLETDVLSAPDFAALLAEISKAEPRQTTSFTIHNEYTGQRMDVQIVGVVDFLLPSE